MKLNKEMEIQIVREMARILSHTINVMDETGIIIASSDARRVGKQHADAE